MKNWMHFTLPFGGEAVSIRTADLLGLALLVAGIVVAGVL